MENSAQFSRREWRLHEKRPAGALHFRSEMQRCQLGFNAQKTGSLRVEPLAERIEVVHLKRLDDAFHVFVFAVVVLALLRGEKIVERLFAVIGGPNNHHVPLPIHPHLIRQQPIGFFIHLLRRARGDAIQIVQFAWFRR